LDKQSRLIVAGTDSLQSGSSLPRPLTAGGKENESIYNTSRMLRHIPGIRNIDVIRKNLAQYTNDHLPSYLGKFLTKVIAVSFSYPIVFLFVIFIIFFILNLIVITIVLRYTNHQKNRKERYISIYKNRYEEVLSSYLFNEIDWNTAYIRIKKKNKWINKEILVSVLSNFQENLRGDFDRQIPEIFYNLGLHTFAMRSVNSPYYYRKVYGIRQLTQLYPDRALEAIEPYINDPHDLVRAEAQASYIVLHPDHPFEFLKNLSRPFTRWTQLTAFNLYRSHQLTVPSFVEYLESDHTYVRNFSLRMIIYFQQVENAPAILKMLDSPLENTRFLCIRAIHDLLLYEGKDRIKSSYDTETGKNQIEIIKAFKNVGNEEDFSFLEHIIRNGSVTARTEACRSLFYMSEEGRQRVLLLQSESGLQIEQYLAHITDPRN